MTRGFTLIEMAIVLVVIGLVVSGGLFAVTPIIQNAKVSETRARLDRLEDALTLYAMQYTCLPCPAAVAGDGTAQFTGAASGCGTGCTSVRGVVPWQTLGLSRADGADAFGTRISYEVTAALVVAGSMTRSGTTYTPLGTITVNTAAGAAVTTAAAYVLVSHGLNRHFGYLEDTGTQVSGAVGTSTIEDLNEPLDSTYVQDNYRPAPDANYFDDIVRWRSKPIIVQMCGEGACGNPS
ncbi:MAG: type II secretion system protein [Rhodospirillaceae bacterium]